MFSTMIVQQESLNADRVETTLYGTFHVQVIGAGDFQVTFGIQQFWHRYNNFFDSNLFLFGNLPNILTFRADEFGSLLGSDHP